MRDVDVLIVGAGPAGTSCAMSILSNSDLDVLILERGERPTSICGGGIAFHNVDKIGIEIPGSVIQSIVTRAVVRTGRSEARIAAEDLGVDHLAYIVDRAKFDAYLLDSAERMGAEVWTGCTFTRVLGRDDAGWCVEAYRRRENERKLISARCIVCADGVTSSVAGKFGIRTGLKPDDLALAYQVYVEPEKVDGDAVEVDLDRRFTRTGYVWLFPGRGYTKIGVGSLASEGNDLRRSLTTYIAVKVDGGCRIVEEMWKALPSAKPPRRLVYWGGSVALAGDAARLCDPLTGGGIANAMISGRVLGKLITEGRVKDYDRMLKPLKRENSMRYRLRNLLLRMSEGELDRLVERMERYEFRADRAEEEIRRFALSFILRNPRLILKLLI